MPGPKKTYATNAARQAAYRRRLRTRIYHRSGRQDWATPQSLFAKLNRELGPFTLDAAASPENAKCERFYVDDSLAQPWTGRVWLNPPYGRDLGRWIGKAIASARAGAAVVMLLPARTGTRWFVELQKASAEIRFLPGRVIFEGGGRAPFDSMVAVLDQGVRLSADLQETVAHEPIAR